MPGRTGLRLEGVPVRATLDVVLPLSRVTFSKAFRQGSRRAVPDLVLWPHRFAGSAVVAVGCAVTSDPTAGGAVAEPVRVRRLTDQEGQKLQQVVRRGSVSSVRYRRAMMLPASAGGNRVPVIAQLVQADEDTVRDVIHAFNEEVPS
ncbi:hypothetical protein GCM10023084_63150 [Streptomyces lacrimifluminis]|uniref:Uncharacterized protein n=1 Tax=Streptomyces lacrimifluminis TaxID=1500077 RepID=A0A917L4E6_9ACTN|nr:hypothetical protein GCM10012282_44200 [Streptomyces lacrimifluminis]